MLIHPGGPLLYLQSSATHHERPSLNRLEEEREAVQGLRPRKEENENFQLLNLFSKDNFAHTKQQFTTV